MICLKHSKETVVSWDQQLLRTDNSIICVCTTMLWTHCYKLCRDSDLFLLAFLWPGLVSPRVPEQNAESILYPGQVGGHHLRMARLDTLVNKPEQQQPPSFTSIALLSLFIANIHCWKTMVNHCKRTYCIPGFWSRPVLGRLRIREFSTLNRLRLLVKENIIFEFFKTDYE